MRRLLILLLLLAVPAWAAIAATGTASNAVGNGNNTTIDTLGMGLVQGAVVIIAGGHPYRAAADLGPLTGFTEIVSSNVSGFSLGVWYRIVTATPLTSFECYGTGNALDACAYVAIGLTGVDVDHIADTLATAANGSSTNPDPASIETVTDGAWVLACGGSEVNDATPGTISGYTNDVSANANDTYDATVALATKLIVSATTEDPGAWSTWGSGDWRTYTVAIRPEVTAPPTYDGDFFLMF